MVDIISRRWRVLLIILLPWMFNSEVNAALTIEIGGDATSRTTIAIVPFDGESSQQAISTVFESDLMSSGRFDSISRSKFPAMPNKVKDVQYSDWRDAGVFVLVIGNVRRLSNDKYEISYRLLDVFSETQLAGNKYTVKASLFRKVAHKISDIVYEKLTGIPGAFDTKIAYVQQKGDKRNKRYMLQISDADGYRPITILDSKSPIMSTAWSPQADKLAYVSMEKKRSQIYVQDLRSGKRSLVSDFPGINSSPAWSPDGNQLAMSLSKDGNAEIYIKDMRTEALTRLTHNPAIDTEPAWSSDGKNIIFSSARDGKPQIYQISAQGGQAQRLTIQGTYNATASYSPDGSKIVLISNVDGGFKVAVYDLQLRSIKTLTSTAFDESPSFAPNGDTILYSTVSGGKNVLAIVSVDGSAQQVLRINESSVKAPAWSPRL